MKNEQNTEKKDKFVVIEQDEIPDIINFDETPEVIGVLKSFKTIKLDGKNVVCAIFEDDGKRFGVWMSTGLNDLSNISIETKVRLISLGMEKIRKGKGYWRKFEISFDPTTGGFIREK